MLDERRQERLKKRFAAIESSFRIEGMDPSGDAIYEQAKASVLAGRMTPKQALSFAVEHSLPAQRLRTSR
ncbi:MAG TPA: hypothetical protein VGM02_15710 [Acidobacteriaceae bacterium]|jgi:hypothetical protein